MLGFEKCKVCRYKNKLRDYLPECFVKTDNGVYECPIHQKYTDNKMFEMTFAELGYPEDITSRKIDALDNINISKKQLFYFWGSQSEIPAAYLAWKAIQEFKQVGRLQFPDVLNVLSGIRDENDENKIRSWTSKNLLIIENFYIKTTENQNINFSSFINSYNRPLIITAFTNEPYSDKFYFKPDIMGNYKEPDKEMPTTIF